MGVNRTLIESVVIDDEGGDVDAHTALTRFKHALDSPIGWLQRIVLNEERSDLLDKLVIAGVRFSLLEVAEYGLLPERRKVR